MRDLALGAEVFASETEEKLVPHTCKVRTLSELRASSHHSMATGKLGIFTAKGFWSRSPHGSPRPTNAVGWSAEASRLRMTGHHCMVQPGSLVAVLPERRPRTGTEIIARPLWI